MKFRIELRSIPFDFVPTVTLSESRRFLSGEVEEKVGTAFIPFVIGTGLRVTIADSDH
jgi:hypothetical protein